MFLSFAQQLIFVVVADVMKIQPKPCSFSEVKVVFPFQRTLLTLRDGCLLIFAQIPLAAAMLGATRALPAGDCSAEALEVGGSQGNGTLAQC